MHFFGVYKFVHDAFIALGFNILRTLCFLFHFLQLLPYIFIFLSLPFTITNCILLLGWSHIISIMIHDCSNSCTALT